MEVRLPAAPGGPAAPSRLVAGVDGCRGGWLVAVADGDDGTVHSVRVTDSIASIVDDPELVVVVIDMPIGLPAGGPRPCDVEARRLCGPRRASVFPAPARAVLDAPDHTTAVARSLRAIGRGLSVQSWNLVPRVAELDAAMTPAQQARVREAHPELAFRRLLGHPAVHSKRSPAGRAERVDALRAGGLVGVECPWAPAPPGSAPDDVLDAIALTTIARRALRGEVEILGDGEVDERGLRAEIVW